MPSLKKTFSAALGCQTERQILALFKGTKIQSLYSNGEFYDSTYKGYKGDASFYSNLVKQGDRVLYIGVGTGRIYSRLQGKSVNVFGIDKSKKMVSRMLDRYPKVNKKNLIIDDILTAKLKENSFDKIVAPFSFFTQFPKTKTTKILKRVHQLLKKNGVLCTDFFSPFETPKDRSIEISRKSAGNNKAILIYCYFKKTHRLNEYTVFEKNKKMVVLELKLHAYFPNQIKKLLKSSGFQNVEIRSSFDNRKSNQQGLLVVSARKK